MAFLSSGNICGWVPSGCPPHTVPCRQTDIEPLRTATVKCPVLEPDGPRSRPMSTALQLCINSLKLPYQLSMAANKQTNTPY